MYRGITLFIALLEWAYHKQVKFYYLIQILFQYHLTALELTCYFFALNENTVRIPRQFFKHFRDIKIG